MGSKWCVVDQIRTPKGAIVWVAMDRKDDSKRGVGMTLNSAISNLFIDSDEEIFDVELAITNTTKQSVYLEA